MKYWVRNGLFILLCTFLATCTDNAVSLGARDQGSNHDASIADLTPSQDIIAVGDSSLKAPDGKQDLSANGNDLSKTADAQQGDGKSKPDACIPTVPATEICDGVDNDCNGMVDDVDKGKDGIYDCLKIALFGTAGAYSSSDFQAWLKSNGVSVDRVQTDTTKLTKALLDKYQIIFLDQLVRDYDATEAELLKEWIAEGGGLMSMTGYTGSGPDRVRPNTLLSKIGLEYQTGLYNGPVKEFLTHPISQGITTMIFNGGYPVSILKDVTGGVNTIVANLPNKITVGIAQERSRGRVFVWGDEWIEFDSEWKSLPMVKQFWVNILGWLGHYR